MLVEQFLLEDVFLVDVVDALALLLGKCGIFTRHLVQALPDVQILDALVAQTVNSLAAATIGNCVAMQWRRVAGPV